MKAIIANQENTNHEQQNIKNENKNQEESKEDVEMDDMEAQFRGTKKLNEALFEAIVDIQKEEFTQDQEIIQSRAFNRLLRNGHQILQAYDELLKNNQELEKMLNDQNEESNKSLQEIQRNYDSSISQLHSQLQATELQMKISQIEKDNLKTEINQLKAVNIDELKKDNEDLKKSIEALEEENTTTKDDLQKALKDEKTLSDRMNKLRIEYDNYLNSVKKAGEDSIENHEIIENQSKQIKDLTEESNGYKSQLENVYSDMESIYKANQDLESKNKL